MWERRGSRIIKSVSVRGKGRETSPWTEPKLGRNGRLAGERLETRLENAGEARGNWIS